MKKFVCIAFALFHFLTLPAQVPYNAALPNGGSKKASVTEAVGLSLVTISYHRPAVRGREGKIWGGVVHSGFVDPGFGSRRPAPWRAGANETTLIEFEDDVRIEGKPLPRGRYGFFIAYDSIESLIIFSRATDSWGSFFYDEADDVLRVKVRPARLDRSVEYLKYEFTDQTPSAARVLLSWERRSLSFLVEVDEKKQQLAALVAESRHPQGFTSQGLTLAANWCLQNNYGLEQGLQWANLASAPTFPGNPASFAALSTKAALLDRLGRTEEATTALRNALPLGTAQELQQFGRQLIGAKSPKAALIVFEFAHGKQPDQFPTLLGMARGLSANGQWARALEFAEQALPLAPNPGAKDVVQGMIVKLKAEKDIN